MTIAEHRARVVVCGQDGAALNRLGRRLVEDRYEALLAGTADEALQLCRHHVPDLLIVDFDLPGDDGPELVRRVREAHWLKTRIDPYLPVLVLRSRDERAQDVDLLAAECLDRPFTYEDLRARIDAILRRRHSRLDDPVQVGDLSVDPARRKVTVGEREVSLARKEFALLRILASDPSRVFTKEELLRDVWGLSGPATSNRTLDSHASRLRRKLDPDGRRFVLNCWGIGYKLVDSVDETQADDEGPPDEQTREGGQGPTGWVDVGGQIEIVRDHVLGQLIGQAGDLDRLDNHRDPERAIGEVATLGRLAFWLEYREILVPDPSGEELMRRNAKELDEIAEAAETAGGDPAAEHDAMWAYVGLFSDWPENAEIHDAVSPSTTVPSEGLPHPEVRDDA